MDGSYTNLFGAIAQHVPQREALVWGDQRWSYADVVWRANQFAQLLASKGIGLHADPERVENWQSPHHHVALYLRNHPDYLTAMLGAWRARASATNINYRYVEDELAYVFADQQAKVIVYHGSFASTLQRVLDRIEPPSLLLRVDDGAGDELLAGAQDFDASLAMFSGEVPPRNDHSPSDRYVLYTGGTTGAPKGVLWRQDDFAVRALGLVRADGSEFDSISEILERAERRSSLRVMPLPPFMHGAAHWNALSTWLSGGTVVLPDNPERFDPIDALNVMDREAVVGTVIVGDAFARPLLDALAAGAPKPRSLRHILSSGAILSRPLKQALHEELRVRIFDVLGSSESGRQAMDTSTGSTPVFESDPSTVVLDDARERSVLPGSTEIGWVASSGRVPLGYLGDRVKTQATFPTLDGVRYVVAGDRARLTDDGSIELHGRESVTINSGGEKIFAEEVERALKEHEDVADVLVVGRPSTTWGSEVVAVVATRSGNPIEPDELTACAASRLARFKLPKDYVFVEHVPRSPSGKPDYAEAQSLVATAFGVTFIFGS